MSESLNAIHPIVQSLSVPDPWIIIFCVLLGLFSVGACWLFRNEATRYISPTFVVVISPFSAIITGTLSLIFGMDEMSPTLVISAVMILGSVIVSGLSDKRASDEATKIKQEESVN